MQIEVFGKTLTLTCKTRIKVMNFYKIMKSSHSQYGHFTLDDFFQTHNNSLNFDGSVKTHFSKSLGLISGTIFDKFTEFLRQIR